jgi:hypothetical protein
MLPSNRSNPKRKTSGLEAARVAAMAGTATLTIGILTDSAEQAGTRLAAAFRQRQPADPFLHPHRRGDLPRDG